MFFTISRSGACVSLLFSALMAQASDKSDDYSKQDEASAKLAVLSEKIKTKIEEADLGELSHMLHQAADEAKRPGDADALLRTLRPMEPRMMSLFYLENRKGKKGFAAAKQEAAKLRDAYFSSVYTCIQQIKVEDAGDDYVPLRLVNGKITPIERTKAQEEHELEGDFLLRRLTAIRSQLYFDRRDVLLSKEWPVWRKKTAECWIEAWNDGCSAIDKYEKLVRTGKKERFSVSDPDSPLFGLEFDPCTQGWSKVGQMSEKDKTRFMETFAANYRLDCYQNRLDSLKMTQHVYRESMEDVLVLFYTEAVPNKRDLIRLLESLKDQEMKARILKKLK